MPQLQAIGSLGDGMSGGLCTAFDIAICMSAVFVVVVAWSDSWEPRRGGCDGTFKVAVEGKEDELADGRVGPLQTHYLLFCQTRSQEKRKRKKESFTAFLLECCLNWLAQTRGYDES
jgi:hypothetical protein